MVLDMSQVANSSEDGRWFQLVTSGSPNSDLTVVAIGYFFVVTNSCNQLDTTGYRPQTYFILFFFKKEKTHEPNPTWLTWCREHNSAHQDQSCERNPRVARQRWWPWWQWWHQSLTLVQTIGCFRQGHPFRKPCGVVLRKQSAGNHTF
jgi:hypothetical protein